MPMTASDWIVGFALAAFLALPFGMVVTLVATITEKPEKYDPKAPLVSSVDIRRCLTASAVFVMVFTPLHALMISKDRSDRENWQIYVHDHRCIVVDSRNKMRFRLNPATKMNETRTVTEYLWRCKDGDEHWR